MKWSLRIFLIHLLASGVNSVVTVEQPSVLNASLGQNIILPCTFKVSSDDRLIYEPVLYWNLLEQGHLRGLWPPSEKYQGRVQPSESGKWSILLKHIQWEDGGRYQCKLSVTTQNQGSIRKRGRGTELLLYDEISFQPTNLNANMLRCQVRVSNLSGFDLSISQSGRILKSTGGSITSSQYVTLFQTVTLGRHFPYECGLRFNGELLTSSIFLNESGSTSSDEKYHQPWVLYGGLLLVQVVCLLVMAIAMLYQLLSVMMESIGC